MTGTIGETQPAGGSRLPRPGTGPYRDMLDGVRTVKFDSVQSVRMGKMWRRMGLRRESRFLMAQSGPGCRSRVLSRAPGSSLCEVLPQVLIESKRTRGCAHCARFTPGYIRSPLRG